MKYLRIKKPDAILGDDVIVIFSEQISHDIMASCFSDKIVSAGFVKLDNDVKFGNVCYGESVSLRLKSIPEEDTKLLQSQYWDDWFEQLE